MKIELLLGDGMGRLLAPAVEGGIQWDTERQGVPGKLSFTLLDSGGLRLQEGAAVCLSCDGSAVFTGFLFSQKWDRDGLVRCVAYDQLRYLKNKDTYVYEGKTASELLRMIAEDFRLQTGEIEDTHFKIASRVEDNKTLFDIMYTALDLTWQNTGRRYVLYDAAGGLTLKDCESMQVDLLIHANAAENFDYSSGIDGETYNNVKLVRNNKETGRRDVYVARDSSHIGQWGLLQLFEKLDEQENGQAKADMLLQLHNHPTKNLSVQNAFGDVRVRAGTSLPVILDLGGAEVNNYMQVEKARHRFDEGVHQMDLTLLGGGFDA